ncbi:DNA-binding protein MutS2 [uncultured archaeon]|nr:DNA-binding protein MutS2 [uncultured archaeon]
MPVASLMQIKGVGKKMADSLIKAYGSEEAVLSALALGDVDGLSAVPGVGGGRALSLVRAFRVGGGGWPLKTEAANEVFERLLEVIRRYPVTDGGRRSVNALVVYSDLDGVSRGFSRVKDSVSLPEGTVASVRDALSRVCALKPVKRPFFDDRVVGAFSESAFERAHSLLSKYVSVALWDGPDDLRRQEGKKVFLVTDGQEDVSAGDDVTVVSGEQLNVPDVVPEAVLLPFVQNKETVDALRKVSECVRNEPALSRFTAAFNLEFLAGVSLDEFDEEGRVNEGVVREVDKALNVSLRLVEAVERETKAINERVGQRLEAEKVTVSASALLNLAAGGNIEQVMPALASIVEEEIDAAVSRLKTEFDGHDSLMEAAEWFNETYPVKANLEAAEAVAAASAVEASDVCFRRISFAARKLVGKRKSVDEALAATYELDLFVALGVFARENNLTEPKPGEGLGFAGGRNLFIKDARPVNYSLGSKLGPNERVAVLTGANSGGKTTLLTLLMQVQLLAQMGLYVPATEAEFKLVEEFYYITKHRGTMNAGAFEESLKTLVPLASAGVPRMVLVDELEAVTEPGAAASVLSVLLHLLAESGSHAVFVTHLSQEIATRLPAGVRIDGIEAEGLDENLNLIVDRQPKYGVVGRSTPELIVRRLFHTADGQEKEAYSLILETMKKDAAEAKK